MAGELCCCDEAFYCPLHALLYNFQMINAKRILQCKMVWTCHWCWRECVVENGDLHSRDCVETSWCALCSL